MVDNIGHSFKPNCSVIRSMGGYAVVADEDIKAGTELTRNFGNLDTYDFIVRFGMLDETSPYHTFLAYPETYRGWNIVMQQFGLVDTTVISELENPNGYSIKSLKKALFKKHNIVDVSEWKLTFNPPQKDFETASRIICFSLKTDIEDRHITNVEQILELDFTKKISDINQDRACNLIYYIAKHHRDVMQQISMEGSHPISKRWEQIEIEICKANVEYYRRNSGRYAKNLTDT